MSLIVVWVDRSEGKLFEFTRDGVEKSALHARKMDHHTHRTDAFDRQRSEKNLFEKIALNLGDASQILIMGPGMAKHHFQSHLVEQCPAVARKIVGCETADHPTDQQITAFAAKFFKYTESAPNSA